MGRTYDSDMKDHKLQCSIYIHEFRNLRRSQNIILEVMSWGMRYQDKKHGCMTKAYRILVSEPEGKKPLSGSVKAPLIQRELVKEVIVIDDNFTDLLAYLKPF